VVLDDQLGLAVDAVSCSRDESNFRQRQFEEKMSEVTSGTPLAPLLRMPPGCARESSKDRAGLRVRRGGSKARRMASRTDRVDAMERSY